MLSCPAHVVNNLVFETEKLKKAEKVYTCTWYVAYVAYAREKFWNMRAWHVYVHCLISEQANKIGRFRIVK